MTNCLKPLILGDLKIDIPLVQGGMGVRVSTAPLAGAVANCGAVGTIAGVGLADEEDCIGRDNFFRSSRQALVDEIHKTRDLTKGVIGVNLMVALTNYEDLARAAAREDINFIVSGAGLPLKLPEFTLGTDVKLIPIVSSGRVAELIIRTWKKRYNRVPDAIVIEGPLAGGHLGYKFEELESDKADNLDHILVEVLKITGDSSLKIPIIVGGGIFDGNDIARVLNLGASGVQMGTRFVTTNECSVSNEFKQAYLNASEKDTTIIKSPVGLPGRSIKTKFIDDLLKGIKAPFECKFKCLKTCDPKTAPYCIAKAMVNAFKGKIDDSVVFAGSSVFKIKKIISVKELINELISETCAALAPKNAVTAQVFSS
ncbi:nitronate monooxygenase family protein [bacterium]|jgi:NAD(P)H-dependent flavin oxidoreductase YrpB (nitropropane dioxygenase family)|nr:nitronate monooxygenase family protein [bacterium]